jgi:hypothetical protein
MRRAFSALLSLLLLTLVPRSGAACWDGVAARHGRVVVNEHDQEGTSAWSPELVLHHARWIRRIDALLPPGASVELDHLWITLRCPAATDNSLYWRGTLPELFERVAARCGVPAARRARALATTVTVYTVQVLATASELRAREVARAVDATERGAHGFIEVGGFPAFNPTAHVLSDGGVHRVVVGAFLDRGQAAALAASLGGGAWVRAL